MSYELRKKLREISAEAQAWTGRFTGEHARLAHASTDPTAHAMLVRLASVLTAGGGYPEGEEAANILAAAMLEDATLLADFQKYKKHFRDWQRRQRRREIAQPESQSPTPAEAPEGIPHGQE